MTGILGGLIGSYAGDIADFELIASISPGGTNEVAFTSIPQNYTHLQIRFIARTDGVSGNNIALTFNGGGGNFLHRHSLIGDGSAATSTSNVSGGTIALVNSTTFNTSTAGAYGIGIIDILDANSTTKTKSLRSFNGFEQSASGVRRISVTSGVYPLTLRVSSLQLATSAGNFAGSTLFSLYGIRG